MKLSTTCLVFSSLLAVTPLNAQAVENSSDSGNFAIELNYDTVPAITNSTKRDLVPAEFGELSKRSTSSRPINQCPGEANSQYTVFAGSTCLELRSPAGRYMLHCHRPESQLDIQHYEGACRHDEYCSYEQFVNPPDYGPHGMASCISGGDFLLLAQARQADMRRRVTLVPQGNGINQMEMLLVEERNDNSLFRATRMTVAARDFGNNTLGKAIWCDDCSSTRFLDWPAKTSNFDANITLPHVNDVAVLHVDGWSN